jgi:hypothetical protein
VDVGTDVWVGCGVDVGRAVAVGVIVGTAVNVTVGGGTGVGEGVPSAQAASTAREIKSNATRRGTTSSTATFVRHRRAAATDKTISSDRLFTRFLLAPHRFLC